MVDIYLVDAPEPLLAVYLFGFGVSVIDIKNVRLANNVKVKCAHVDLSYPQTFLTIISHFKQNKTLLNVIFVSEFYTGDQMTYHLEMLHYSVNLVESRS